MLYLAGAEVNSREWVCLQVMQQAALDADVDERSKSRAVDLDASRA
ncbi:hypothetical protein SynMVIR181_01145 [Synechococcus sp. MVIR-18-1]|nr:hypothetical protein SynMVIR181_01145 [Synechococcus sp. MVIR-18-1]